MGPWDFGGHVLIWWHLNGHVGFDFGWRDRATAVVARDARAEGRGESIVSKGQDAHASCDSITHSGNVGTMGSLKSGHMRELPQLKQVRAIDHSN